MGAGIQRWWRSSERYEQECGEYEARWTREQSRVVFDSAMDGIDAKLRCYLENCRLCVPYRGPRIRINY